MLTSYARWPVTDRDIDPGSDMPKPIDQWQLIQAARQIEDAPQARPSFWTMLTRRAA